MARGRDKHAAHVAAVAALGRTLSRRAKNRCELCEASTSLKVIEVAPTEEEPTVERAVLICGTCESALAGKKVDSNAFRFLEGVVWSEVLPVQLSAVRLLQRFADEGAAWARECLDGLFLDPEVESLV